MRMIVFPWGRSVELRAAHGLIPQDADVAQLATGSVAAVQGGYLLAQPSRDVTPMASAIDMAMNHLILLGPARDRAS